MVYVMNLKMNFGLPSTHYYRTVHQGYMDCCLDTDVLAEALGDSAQKFYTSALRNPSYQISRSFPTSTSLGEYENEECNERKEPDESDPFCSPDGMQWKGF